MKVSKPPERLTHETFMSVSSPFRIFQHHIHSQIDLHWHEFYELGFITSGTGTHILNGQVHFVGPGSIFLLTPADFHEIVPDHGCVLQLYNMIFSDHMLKTEMQQMLFGENLELASSFQDNELDLIEGEFARIWREAHDWRMGSQTVIQGALERILIDLARKCLPMPETKDFIPESGLGKSIRNAVIYIQHHFREPITLEDAARQVQLSPNYFSEYFHKTLGISFQVYVQGLRLLFAQSLLRVSDIPITEICLASGFNTLTHFERAFKKKYDQTPREYRKKMGEQKREVLS